MEGLISATKKEKRKKETFIQLKKKFKQNR